VARDAMPTTSDGDQQAIRTGKVHCGNNVGHTLTLDNYRWPTIDHAVPDATRHIVCGIFR
jgi:hypothetical protein